LKNIFVGNLSFKTTETDVRTLFEQHGQVNRVQLITDRDTGRAKGFGFVEMPNDDEGINAIKALNGKEVDGRALNINEAQPKTSGGGGRGFGGGRGGSSRDDYSGSARQPREPRW
jgi:cold-inducible RNA-binding protein